MGSKKFCFRAKLAFPSILFHSSKLTSLKNQLLLKKRISHLGQKQGYQVQKLKRPNLTIISFKKGQILKNEKGQIKEKFSKKIYYNKKNKFKTFYWNGLTCD